MQVEISMESFKVRHFIASNCSNGRLFTTVFKPRAIYTKHLCTTKTLHKKSLTQKPLTTETFLHLNYTRNHLHQPTFTPNCLFHFVFAPKTFCTIYTTRPTLHQMNSLHQTTEEHLPKQKNTKQNHAKTQTCKHTNTANTKKRKIRTHKTKTQAETHNTTTQKNANS